MTPIPCNISVKKAQIRGKKIQKRLALVLKLLSQIRINAQVDE
jgi:hypothetical protein